MDVPIKFPLVASGEGCDASKILWMLESTRTFFSAALFPKRRNIRERLSAAAEVDKRRISSSVSLLHPQLWCEPGWCNCTVNVLLSSSTPWAAQLDRSPCFQSFTPRVMPVYRELEAKKTNTPASANILTKLGGGFTPFRTEKAKPIACDTLW